MKRSLPSSPNYYTTHYDKLRGVDYSCDITEVSRVRTPTGLNMISDDGGNPVKRSGWRVIADVNCGKILEIIFHEDDLSTYDRLKKYIIGSTGIYAVVTKDGIQNVVTMLSASITSASYFMFGGEVYVFVNGGMYKLEGITAVGIDDKAYIPEVTISKNPDGTGGQSLESANLLTPKRIFAFLGDSTSKDYYLYPEGVRNDNLYKYIVKDTIKVELLTTDGWTVTTDYTLPDTVVVKGKDVDGSIKSFNVCIPKITFAEAHEPLVSGQDNVRVTFEAFDDTTDSTVDGETIVVGLYSENRIDLLATTSCMTYGYSAADRVFLVGGKHKNKVYYSGVNQPMYYPDDNYITVGHDSNGITGLHRVSEYLAAVKDDSAIEGTVFLISGAYLNDEMYFKVTPTSAGTGAIAPKSFSTLVDEPLFLSRSGVFAIANYYTTTEKVIRNRSYYLDKKLLKEPNLEEACAITYRRYYILCVNDHCYVLDGRSRSQDKNNNTDYLYEAYYWENVPAKVFYVWQNELYFGDAEGHLCKFNTDITNRTKYCDNGIESVNSEGVMSMTGGVAIPCEWSTPLDDDGRPQYFKTLNKKGSLLSILPYERTSAKVSLVKDGDIRSELGIFYADIQTWELIDFERFTFNSNDTAQDDFFRKKIKKYKRLQIIVRNDGIYEPFGILGITKTYTIGNFSKNRG